MKRFKWIVDDEANNICWEELREEPLDLLRPTPIKVLDIGGGPGSFSSIMYRGNKSNLIVSIDINFQALKRVAEGINPINGDILRLPFKSNSYDAVLGRAILHHIPNHVGRGISEINRVVKDGGSVVLQEPCDKNIFANMARKLFRTEIHEEAEIPLDQKAFLEVISKQLELKKVGNHFFFSYLMPHITARLGPLRGPLVSLTRFLVAIDKQLMRYGFFKKRAAYLSVVASKGMKK